MDTKDVIQRFYEGLARKDISWQDNLAESVAFADASGSSALVAARPSSARSVASCGRSTRCN
jgi:hypothetical protein